uniref:RNA-directed DNA polymerase n=2 Tax=Meloidogyne TaxID=189290 RepID=A0A6V7VWK9_MELEN|nr:unnamed protein product [Meloidogyne enterolobii]
MSKTMNFAFYQSLRSFCELLEVIKRWTEATYMSNPTELARSMFSNPYLVAKRSGMSLMKVWPCVPLEKSDYEFRPTKMNECFEFIPITLRTESKEHLAFLDPTTMIISPSSRKSPCHESRNIVVQINDQILEIDQIEGKITSVRPNVLKIHELKLNFTELIPKIESHAFHQLVLLNMTDIKDHAFVSNMVRTSQITYQIKEKETGITTSVSQEWEEVENQLVRGVVGDYKQIWAIIISVIVIILAIDLSMRLLMVFAEMYAGNGRLGKLIFGTKIEKPVKRMMEIRRINEPRIEEDATYEEPVVNRLSVSWPPTVRNAIESGAPCRSPLNIGSVGRRGFIGALGPNAATVIVDVNLNDMPLRCLVDTGAITSVANIALADRIGAQVFQVETFLQSASEHPMCARQAMKAQLGIAGAGAEIIINLFNDKFHWHKHDYHFILGCDALAQLPPIQLDLRNKSLIIKGNILKLDNKMEGKLRDIKVRALATYELRPNEQCLIKGKVQFPELLRQDIMFHTIDQKLSDEGLSFVPIVTNPKSGVVPVIISNPTGEVKRVFKGKGLGLVNEIYETSHENVLSEFEKEESGVSEQELNSLGKSKVIIDPSFKIDFTKSSVKNEELKKLKELCEEFGDVFSKSQYDLGNCTAGEHDIVTTSEEPVTSRPHRVPFKYRDELQKHIDQLLASGVMIESDTPWVSNIVLVQKKDGGLRPCIDFRKLNEITVPDHFPLPRLETILERVGNCRYYTSLDLASGYLQIKLSERASRKCGVITEDNVYQMVNLPFGLKNATSAFARVMAHVLTGLENVLAYVDDILIYTKSENFDEHLTALRSVFERFRRFNLKLSPKKCIFASASMEFLGFIVSESGYTPSLRKIETILNLKIPTSVKEVRQVVGMASFFRKHVPNFSTIVEPLTRLTRKERPFIWGKEQQEAFEKVKKILSEKPVLTFPDYTKPFHIFCDASSVGQGGALMQWDEEKKVYSVICYCSRTLSSSERNWPPVQVELGAIIYALRQFKPFIFMSSIELHTDHKPLAFLLKKAETHQNLARWLVELQNYNIKIVHIAGKQNSLADALSRIPHEDLSPEEIEKLEELEDIAEFPVCLAINKKPFVVHEKFGLTMSIRSMEGNIHQIDIRKEQSEDPEASILIDFLKSGNFPEDISEEEKNSFSRLAKDLCLESGVLYFHHKHSKPRIYVPVSLRAMIFDSFHTTKLGGGHMDFNKTLKKCLKYFWPRMHADIVTWHKQCITCQLRHSPNPPYRAEMCTPPINTLFAKVGLDLAGPFPKTQNGNKHILNIVCWFTKFVISVPIPDAKASTIASAFLKNCYLKFGGCTELITDNATAFTSEFFKSFCAMLYINKTYAVPHWSQGNAVTERSFRTFHNILAKYINKDQPDFDEHLEFANFCYNTSVHYSTNETPFFLMYGRDPIFCVDLILDPKVREPVALNDEAEIKQKLIVSLRQAWKYAAESNRDAQLRAKTQYDKLIRNPTITIGDRVLLRNYTGKVGTSKKFHLPWKGVFRVIGIDGVRVTITSCNSPQSNPRIVHINQLKKCVEPLNFEPACTNPNLDQEESDALVEVNAEELIDEPGYSHNIDNNVEKVNDKGTEELGRRNTITKYNLRKNPKQKILILNASARMK